MKIDIKKNIYLILVISFPFLVLLLSLFKCDFTGILITPVGHVCAAIGASLELKLSSIHELLFVFIVALIYGSMLFLPLLWLGKARKWKIFLTQIGFLVIHLIWGFVMYYYFVDIFKNLGPGD